MAHPSSHHLSIPKLDLEEFHFSPPGSMGWSYAEYEKIVDSDEEQLEMTSTSTITSSMVPDQPLIELPVGAAGERPVEEREEELIEEDVVDSGGKLELVVEEIEKREEEKQEVDKRNEYVLQVKSISRPQQLFNKNCKLFTQDHRESNEYFSKQVTLEDQLSDIDESLKESAVNEDMTNDFSDETAGDQVTLSEMNSVTETDHALIQVKPEEPEEEQEEEPEPEKEPEEELEIKDDFVYKAKSKGSSRPPWLALNVRKKNK